MLSRWPDGIKWTVEITEDVVPADMRTAEGDSAEEALANLHVRIADMAIRLQFVAGEIVGEMEGLRAGPAYREPSDPVRALVRKWAWIGYFRRRKAAAITEAANG